MIEQILTLLPLVAPMLLLLFSSLLLIGKKELKSKLINQLPKLGGIGIVLGLISAFTIFNYGTLQKDLLVWFDLGLSVRLDSLSITMFVMITLLGFIVIRFSKNYLEGDKRQHVFLARLVATIAAVELLVLSGNIFQIFIFWVATSISLHYLLIFYRDRPQAVAAARKKFIVARLGDLSLFVALALIYNAYGTGDLGELFNAIKLTNDFGIGLSISAVLLVFAALLKSAQFPSHGWLIEVVETPTPVSALLHAGLLNAGPFLMVRMSFLMSEFTAANILLILVGGFTALFASVVFLTQPSVKVALGYSSVAHMGFMLLICGFGVYTAAILHLVAHSFYKAHAFLSSGSVVDTVRAQKISLPKRKGDVKLVMLSVFAAALIYAFFCYMWGINPQEDFALMATGVIIVMGLSQIITPTLDASGGFKSVLMSAGMAFAVALSFFTLEQGAHHILHSQIPSASNPNLIIQIAVSFVVVAFGLVVLTQLLSPNWKSGTLAYKLGIHLRNGFYANAYFDSVIGALENKKFSWINLAIPEEKSTMAELTLEDVQVIKEAV